MGRQSSSGTGGRVTPVRLVLLTLLGGALATSVQAGPCKQFCKPAIARCVGTGYTRRSCKRQLVRACKQLGVVACELAFTPPTTVPTPPTTVPAATTTTTIPPIAVCPLGYPVDCGNGYCCPVTLPVCGTDGFCHNPPPACGGNLHVLAQDGTYLGCWTCSQFSVYSIFNQFGSYGSAFSATSIWNHFGAYGSAYSALSPCNQFTSTPPALFDDAGCYVGLLTVNQFILGSVCGITGNADICNALIAICSS